MASENRTFEVQPLTEQSPDQPSTPRYESDLEAEATGFIAEQARSPWATRGRALTVGMLVAGAVCGTYTGVNYLKGNADVVDYVTHSHPAFVNLATVPVTDDPTAIIPASDHHGLCSPKLVQDVCNQFYEESKVMPAGRGGSGYKDAHPKTHRQYVHAVEIAEGLSTTRASVINLLKKLEITDKTKDKPDEFAFTCQELCERLVGSYPAGVVPAKSDVGCFTDMGITTCDVDVCPDELAALQLNGMDSDEKKKGMGESKRMKKATGEGAGSKADEEEEAIRQALKADEAGTETAEQKVLMHKLEHLDLDFRTLRLMLSNLFRIFPTTADEIVEEDASLIEEPALPARRLTAKPRNLMTAEQTKAALATGVKAKAAVSATIQKMEGRKVQASVSRWFGNNLDDPTRSNLKRVLNGVQEMLNNVEYSYPGDQCSPNMYAYVYSGAGNPWEKNPSGQYIIYLCDMYMNSSPDYQMEVLLHEGSHHQTMANDDSHWVNDETMYGQTICLTVARACEAGDASACSKALTNADTFEYFVAEAIKDPAELLKLNAKMAGSADSEAPAEGGGGSFR